MTRLWETRARVVTHDQGTEAALREHLLTGRQLVVDTGGEAGSRGGGPTLQNFQKL